MSNKELTPHPQADILIAYAKGKKIQGSLSGTEWKTIANPLVLIDDPTWRLRIKPETITINDHEFPAPVRKPLKEGQSYWLVDPEFTPTYRRMVWGDSVKDRYCLKRGLIQLTEEGASAQAKAMIAACGGEV